MNKIITLSAIHDVPPDVRRILTKPTKQDDVTKLRNDVRLILEAEAAGWEVHFLSHHWHNPARFTKGNVIVWCNGMKYCRDTRIDDSYPIRYTGKPKMFQLDVYGLREALGLM